MNSLARNVGMQSNVGMANSAISAPRSTQVELMLSNLTEEVSMLEKALELHMNKIAPVLRQEPPSSAKEVAAEREYLVPVADAIRTIAERVSNARRRLDSLTERTEA